jgi:hypothetical protein
MIGKKELGMDPTKADLQYKAMLSEFHAEVMKRLNAEEKYDDALKWGNYFMKLGEVDDNAFAQLEKSRNELEKIARIELNRNQADLDTVVASGRITHRELDVLWSKQQEGGKRFFDSYNDVVKRKNFLNENFDSKAKTKEEKWGRQVQVADAFKTLQDAEPGGPEFREFRELLLASKPYLLESQYEYFVRYTGEVTAEELAARTALWDRFKTKWDAVVDSPTGLALTVATLGGWGLTAGILAVFNPEANYDQVRKDTDEIIRRFQANRSVDSLLYKKGDTKDFGPPIGVGVFQGIGPDGMAIWEYEEK